MMPVRISRTIALVIVIVTLAITIAIVTLAISVVTLVTLAITIAIVTLVIIIFTLVVSITFRRGENISRFYNDRGTASFEDFGILAHGIDISDDIVDIRGCCRHYLPSSRVEG